MVTADRGGDVGYGGFAVLVVGEVMEGAFAEVVRGGIGFRFVTIVAAGVSLRPQLGLVLLVSLSEVVLYG